jgi:hypothetical protein
MLNDVQFSSQICSKPTAFYESGLSVGAVSVRVTADSLRDVTFSAKLEPFHCDPASYDIDIRIAWVDEILPTKGGKLFDSGTTWRLYEGNTGFQFDFEFLRDGDQPYKRLIVDQDFRKATLQMRESFFEIFPDAADPLAYPLDELLIMHRLTQEQAIELHGVGMVGPDGASNLFVGHSGAGKSTTARFWTSLHNVEILSDDRIIVRESPARELRPGDDPKQIFMYGTPWHGEGCFALPQRAPLQRIFVLEHGRGNVITRLTPSQAVGELFARAFVPFHRHEYIENAITFLDHLVASVPCYRYSFEPDERAVEKIIHFHD